MSFEGTAPLNHPRPERATDRLVTLQIFGGKKLVRNEAELNFDKACSDFVLFFVKTNDPIHEEISKTFTRTILKC